MSEQETPQPSPESEKSGIPKVTRENVDKFFWDSFDIGQQDITVQENFFHWAKKAGVLEDLKGITRSDIKDAVPPKDHVTKPSYAIDNLKMKTDLMMIANDHQVSKDSEEELALKVFDGMVSRDNSYLNPAIRRPGRGSQEDVRPDSRKDARGSTIKRLFINKEGSQHSVVKYFGEQKIMPLVEKFKPYVFLEEDDDGWLNLDPDDFERALSFRIMVRNWVELHPGKTKEDYFKGE